MISIAHLSAGAVSSKYYHEDGYYSEADGQDKSSWQGSAAREEGLTGPVNDDKFQELLHGHAPDGRDLARVLPDGTRQRRMGYDLTFSAPKDISIMALVIGDKRLLVAHDKAVATTLELVEKTGIKVRVYDPETKDKAIVGDQKAIFAVFRHDTSRKLDPQLHSHAIAVNMAKGPDDKYRAIFNNELYTNRKLYDAHYKATLAKHVHELGYTVRREGKHGDIRIEGVHDEISKGMSKRREQIKEALANSTDPNKSAAAERAALFTRANKAEGVDRVDLVKSWVAEIKDMGHDPVVLGDIMRGTKTNLDTRRDMPQSPHALINSAVRHHSENESLYSEQKLLEYALNKATNIDAKDLTDAIDDKVKRGDLHRAPVKDLPDGITDKQTVAREARMINELQLGRNASHPTMKALSRWLSNPERGVTRALGNTTLTIGQRDAVKTILASDDRIVGVQGYAGTGKTYMLEKAQSLAKHHGYNFEAIGPSRKSVEALQGSNLDATTVASFLINAPRTGIGNKKDTVLVVDEASMISTKDMTDLLRLANKAQYNRVVLMGDVAQLASIGAGSAFRQLQENGLTTAHMNEIQRQKDLNLKAGVEALSKQDVKAAFDKIGDNIQPVKSGEYVRATADKYLSLDPKDRTGTGVIAQSNKARVDLNTHIRDGLIEEGIVSQNGHDKDHLGAVNTSTEDRRHASTYEAGMVLLIHADVKDTNFKQGMELKVITKDIKANTLQVTTGVGPTKTLNLNHRTMADRIGIYAPESREYAKGDAIIFRQNDKGAGVINGARGSIVATIDGGLTVQTDAGNTIYLANNAVALKTMDHAYATTVHSFQGETVDRIIVAMGAKEALTNTSAAYVAISRARYDATLFTDDPAKLQETLEARSGISTTALESLKKAAELSGISIKDEHDSRADHPLERTHQHQAPDTEKDKEMAQAKDQDKAQDQKTDGIGREDDPARDLMEREMRHSDTQEKEADTPAKERSEEVEHER